MVLDTALLSTQHYKVMIKGKVEQSWEWSRALPNHIGVVAIEKRALASPSTKVANFTYNWAGSLEFCRGVVKGVFIWKTLLNFRIIQVNPIHRPIDTIQ